MQIQIPKRSTQDAIASVLSSLGRKISLNRKANEQLESMAKQLYDYWFVQSDFPNAEGKPYKSSGGKMVYNETLKRDIPEGWEGKQLDFFLDIKNGRDHKHLDSGSIPAYGSGGFMRGVNQYLYEGESVLIPRKGSLNNIMYVHGKFLTVDTMYYSETKMPDSAKLS